MNRPVMQKLQRRLQTAKVLEAILALVSAVGLAALVAFLTDALLILPEGVRAWLLPGLILLAVIVLGAGIFAIRRLTALRAARNTERVFSQLGNALTNAVQLSQSATDSPVKEILCRDAVTLGEKEADKLPLWPMVRRGVAICIGAIVVTFVLWLGFVGLFSGVLDAVMPRFFDPRGDHPPYSKLQLKVTLEADKILYGGQCAVRVVPEGAAVDKLVLVSESEGRRAETIMFRRDDGSYFQTLTNLRAPSTVWVTDGRACSFRHKIDITYAPQITLVEWTAHFPEYTGMKDRTEKLGKDEIVLPKGSRLDFRVASNRPLNAGELQVTPLLGGAPVSFKLVPEKDQPSLVTGQIELKDGAVFAITVKDVDGLDSAETVRGRLGILPDRKPRLTVLDPGVHAVATPEIPIPVHVQAQDDYGIADIAWCRSLNGSGDFAESMPLKRKRTVASADAVSAFNLKDLGVRPGDVIEYYFKATDNYPDGPNFVTSSIFTVQIISFEEYQDLLRQQAARQAVFEQYMALTQRLRRVHERAESLRDKDMTEPMAEQARKELQEEMDDLLRELTESRQDLDAALKVPEIADIEESFRESLKQQAAELDKAVAMQRKLSEKMRSGRVPTKEELAALEGMLAGISGAVKRDVGEPATQIALVAELLAEAERFKGLAMAQTRLARLSRPFADAGDVLSAARQLELRALAEQEMNIAKGLDAWQERVQELLEDLPDEEQYEQLRQTTESFLAAVTELRIKEELALASEYLNAPDIRSAVPAVEQVAEHMMSLLSKCNPMQGAGQSCLKFQPSISQNLGNSLQQILNAMNGRGSGNDGDGYGLYGQNVGLYGPDVHLAARRGRGRGRKSSSSGMSEPQSSEVSASDADDPALDNSGKSNIIRLQSKARFPLRYRTLVGEYFRKIAEAEE